MEINHSKIQVGAISLHISSKEVGEINLKIKVDGEISLKTKDGEISPKIKDGDRIHNKIKADGETNLKIKDGGKIHNKIKGGDKIHNKIKVDGVISNRIIKKTGEAIVDGD